MLFGYLGFEENSLFVQFGYGFLMLLLEFLELLSEGVLLWGGLCDMLFILSL